MNAAICLHIGLFFDNSVPRMWLLASNEFWTVYMNGFFKKGDRSVFFFFLSGRDLMVSCIVFFDLLREGHTHIYDETFGNTKRKTCFQDLNSTNQNFWGQQKSKLTFIHKWIIFDQNLVLLKRFLLLKHIIILFLWFKSISLTILWEQFDNLFWRVIMFN